MNMTVDVALGYVLSFLQNIGVLPLLQAVVIVVTVGIAMRVLARIV